MLALSSQLLFPVATQNQKKHYAKIRQKMSKKQLKLKVIYNWSNRGCTVCISQKLVGMPKNISSQDSKTTFNKI